MAVVQKKKIFIGYSTVVTNSKIQQFADIELIKRDLLNHFYTRKGERLMMPTWGCGIWDQLFEPFDDVAKDSIMYQCTQVINADSRVRLQSMNVTEFEHGFQVQMDLLYVPYDVVDTFSLEFDRRTVQSA